VTETSAQRKLARGIEHVQTLRGEAATFVDDEAYVFVVERERRSSQEVKYRCVAVEKKPPPDHWPLLAGEAIQNLRSALDHAVFSLVPKRKRGMSQFPIFTDHCEFQVNGRKQIPRIPAPIAALIEAAQPYNVAPEAPSREFLEILRRLSNIDKHRELATIAVGLARSHIGYKTGIRFSFEKRVTEAPLGHGKTEVQVFTATADKEFDEMDVKPEFTYEVRIEGMPLDVLVGIGRRVFETVTECETGQPKSPFASYPI